MSRPVSDGELLFPKLYSVVPMSPGWVTLWEDDAGNRWMERVMLCGVLENPLVKGGVPVGGSNPVTFSVGANIEGGTDFSMPDQHQSQYRGIEFIGVSKWSQPELFNDGVLPHVSDLPV